MEEHLSRMAELRARIQDKQMGAEGFSSVPLPDQQQAAAVDEVVI
jgi:hypothetical protein